jgi:hypothetical protein
LENYAFSVREFASADPPSRGQYLLDPPYQRGSVWDVVRRRNLVRSLLMGLPIGAVTINERDHRFEDYDPAIFAAVVDGRQRIETIRAFVDSQFAVPADWFTGDDNGDYLVDGVALEPIDMAGEQVPGVRYDQLTRLGRGLFDRTSVAVNHARVLTVAAEAELFLLLNFGGVPQSDADEERARAQTAV